MTLFSRHSSILRTGIILIGIPIAFQLGALGFLLKVQNDAREAEGWEIHSKEVISRTDALERILHQAHAAVRAAGLYRSLDFERDRRDAIARWPGMLLDLRRFVADNPSQQEQLDRVQNASVPYLEWFRQMESVGAAGQWEAYQDELLTAHGKALVDRVEAALTDFTREEGRLDRLRVSRLAAARQRERTVLVGMAVLAVVVAFAMLWFFTRGLSRRVARIAVNGQRLATGDALLEPLPGDDEIASLDAVLHDSARRLAEAAASEKRYASELELRGAALEQANRDLLFKTQENEMFVYSVSHDLRSPLVNVQGFTKELSQACRDLRAVIAASSVVAAERERLEHIVDTDISESIAFIQTAVTRLSGIVDALLRLSRAGRVEFAKERVDLGAVMDRIVRAMRGTIDERAATVTTDPLPAVTGDPVALEQVFANLVGNALNYLNPERPGRVHVGVQEEAGGDAAAVTIYVRDNGLGIPSRYLSKLFMPFERLHGNKVKGEGIGLALTKRIVERQGGRIWAESTENVGTTFFVTLPAAGAESLGEPRQAVRASGG